MFKKSEKLEKLAEAWDLAKAAQPELRQAEYARAHWKGTGYKDWKSFYLCLNRKRPIFPDREPVGSPTMKLGRQGLLQKYGKIGFRFRTS